MVVFLYFRKRSSIYTRRHCYSCFVNLWRTRTRGSLWLVDGSGWWAGNLCRRNFCKFCLFFLKIYFSVLTGLLFFPHVFSLCGVYECEEVGLVWFMLLYSCRLLLSFWGIIEMWLIYTVANTRGWFSFLHSSPCCCFVALRMIECLD